MKGSRGGWDGRGENTSVPRVRVEVVRGQWGDVAVGERVRESIP